MAISPYLGSQQAYYDAISASTQEGQSGPFIDFMLNEIFNTLQKSTKEVPGKVPGKSELSIMELLSQYPSMTRQELAKHSELSDSGVKKIIAGLKKSGWIERAGSDKKGYWNVLYNFE